MVLVEPEELHARLGEKSLVIVDASWHMPAAKRSGHAEFLAEHIPGAVFFDLDSASAAGADLPHMLAPGEVFGETLRKLGVSNDSEVVVYDALGIFSAPRFWWNCTLAGVSNICVLNGGLPKWKAKGLPLAAGATAIDRGAFQARYDDARVTGFARVIDVVNTGGPQIIDARSRERFAGTAPDPRPGVAAGHIAGSRNVPFTDLLTGDGELKPDQMLRAVFDAAEVDLGRPAILSCGSGVTAAVIGLALAKLGHHDWSIYDGAWAEWGSSPDSRHLISSTV